MAASPTQRGEHAQRGRPHRLPLCAVLTHPLPLHTPRQVMVLSQDRERGRVALCTKKLEPTPGDMLRDPGERCWGGSWVAVAHLGGRVPARAALPAPPCCGLAPGV